MPAGVSAITPLANLTLTSNQGSVVFSSISSSYRDLFLVVQAIASNATASQIYLRFNGDTGSNYNNVYMIGNGSSTSSFGNTGETIIRLGGDTIFDNSILGLANAHIMDYVATDKHKTVLGRHGSAATNTAAAAGRWANTGAITSVTVLASNANFGVGSTFALYGVSA